MSILLSTHCPLHTQHSNTLFLESSEKGNHESGEHFQDVQKRLFPETSLRGYKITCTRHTPGPLKWSKDKTPQATGTWRLDALTVYITFADFLRACRVESSNQRRYTLRMNISKKQAFIKHMRRQFNDFSTSCMRNTRCRQRLRSELKRCGTYCYPRQALREFGIRSTPHMHHPAPRLDPDQATVWLLAIYKSCLRCSVSSFMTQGCQLNSQQKTFTHQPLIILENTFVETVSSNRL